jgi:FAD/FMN-containing dehydrogenase
MTDFLPTEGVLSWGRTLRARHDVCRPTCRAAAARAVADGALRRNGVLTIGLGRSYGESGLNPDGALIDGAGLDRLISFDPETRLLRAEAGVSFDALVQFLIPRGFFLPVTPGTRYVTLGGAIANDVHGKNHRHAGAFGAWVRRIGLIRSDADAGASGGRKSGPQEIELTPDDKSGLFAATVGGLGLTGLISWAEIEVIPIASSFIQVEDIAFANLEDFFALSEESASWDYASAWIDCMAKGASMGRGLFSRGRHATNHPLAVDQPKRLLDAPIEFPSFALNKMSVSLLNSVYYTFGKRNQGAKVVSYLPFFYPLDSVNRWNRMYGKHGVRQYQSVIPPDTARDAVRTILRTVSASGQGSFLATLTTFGDRPSPGLISFPREGASLALDFPNRGERTLRLLSRLDDIIRHAGGRLYPAKDGRMPVDLFKSGYPQWEEFARHVDPGFRSAFWRRVAP